MGKTGLAVVAASTLLGGTYLYALPSANQGYGYMGYRGFNQGPSRWDWHDPGIYREPSARTGSRGGPGHRGGGLSRGK